MAEMDFGTAITEVSNFFFEAAKRGAIIGGLMYAAVKLHADGLNLMAVIGFGLFLGWGFASSFMWAKRAEGEGKGHWYIRLPIAAAFAVVLICGIASVTVAAADMKAPTPQTCGMRGRE